VRQAWCRSLPASASVVGRQTPWKGACDPRGCAGVGKRYGQLTLDARRGLGNSQSLGHSASHSVGPGASASAMAGVGRRRSRLLSRGAGRERGSTRCGGDIAARSGVTRPHGRTMEVETQLGCMRRTPTASIVERSTVRHRVGCSSGRAATVSAAAAQSRVWLAHSANRDIEPHRS